MGVLMLDVWEKSQLQDFLALLNQFEAAGITDLRLIRQRIGSNLLVSGRVQVGRTAKKIRPARKLKKLQACPGCGRAKLKCGAPALRRYQTIENGIHYTLVTCKRCFWSEMRPINRR